MVSEPTNKRAHVFFDGQNLFKTAQTAFGTKFPDFDPSLLATQVCKEYDWHLHGIHFYTGIPTIEKGAFWHEFWSRKLAQMGKQGIEVFSRPLRYRTKEFHFGHGGSYEGEFAIEKGIDVRIAIDVLRLCMRNSYDVAVIFSQDQDLSEVADEIRAIAKEQNRWIKVASAFPFGDQRVNHNRRGINKTDWIKIDRTFYNRCIDSRDYRPKSDRR